MTSDMIDTRLILTAITGIAWTIVYIDAIRIGFRHRTYAIPLAALTLNLAWELTYSWLDLGIAMSSQSVNDFAWLAVDIAWAAADIVILYTFFRFGRAEFPHLSKPMFAWGGVLFLASSFAVQWLFVVEFGIDGAVRYSGFLQNVLMSGLFISMFVARRGLRGQTLTIAIAKWVGTLAPTILYGVIEASPFILGLGILCCVLDVVYIGLVSWAKARPDALTAAKAQPEPVAA